MAQQLSQRLQVTGPVVEVAEVIEVQWQQTELDGNRLRVEYGQEEVFEVCLPGQSAEGLLVVDGQQHPFWWARQSLPHGQDKLFLFVAGQVRVYELSSTGPKRSTASGAGASHTGQVVAPMPGTVLQCHCKPGQSVNQGDALVVMESMKMELTLSAPADAVVETVLCQAGQLVDMNAVLVKLSPVDAVDAVEAD